MKASDFGSLPVKQFDHGDPVLKLSFVGIDLKALVDVLQVALDKSPGASFYIGHEQEICVESADGKALVLIYT